MYRALATAATGMRAQQLNIDVTANNMANVNTTGFRRARAEFQDLLYTTIRAPGGTSGDGSTQPTGIQIGQGTKLVSTELIHTQGSSRETGNALDIAIEGDGYFQITRPSGDIAYTRAGNFKTDAQGRLVTAEGFAVEPAITIPPDAQTITISPDGAVSVRQAQQTQSTQVGQLTLAQFSNPGGLLAIGRTMFTATTASGEPLVGVPGQQGMGTVSQGFLEGSNVEVVNEMVDIITSQRAYEIANKVLKTADEMLRNTTQR